MGKGDQTFDSGLGDQTPSEKTLVVQKDQTSNSNGSLVSQMIKQQARVSPDKVSSERHFDIKGGEESSLLWEEGGLVSQA